MVCGNENQKVMMDEKNLVNDIFVFFTKASSYILSIIFGLFGKVGMEIMMKKKYTYLQWIGIVMISIFSGYIASVVCEVYKWDSASHWLPSVATIFGQNIAFYCVYNYKRIGDNIMDVITRKK